MNKLRHMPILLEPEQHRALSEIARRQGRSISGLVREIVQEYLDGPQDCRQQDLDIIRALARTRQQLEAEHGVLGVDLLTRVRAEREQDADRVWRDEPG